VCVLIADVERRAEFWEEPQQKIRSPRNSPNNHQIAEFQWDLCGFPHPCKHTPTFKGNIILISQSIYNIITTSQGKLTAIYPALLAVINNIAAYLENLSSSVSSKLLQLFSSMSSPGFLLTNDSNHSLLQSLLESMNAIIEHQFISKYNLIKFTFRHLSLFRL